MIAGFAWDIPSLYRESEWLGAHGLEECYNMGGIVWPKPKGPLRWESGHFLGPKTDCVLYNFPNVFFLWRIVYGAYQAREEAFPFFAAPVPE